MKNNLSKNTSCAELDNFIGIISCLPEQFTEKWVKMMENKQSNPTKVYGTENENFKDTLNRDAEIKSLSNLLKNIETPTVLAINSKWGTGKSTFINLWEKHLESDNEIETICFNAWKNDFSPDPLIAFLSEMNQFFTKDDPENKTWKKAKDAGIYLTRKALPSMVKIATGNMIDLTEFLDSSALDSTFQDLAKDLSQDAINAYVNYEASKSLIQKFKENLEAAIAEKGKRLVIFVDELDRCRPTYAIELLERIKHLFDIEGLIFVLSLDKEQLSYSIKAVYGQDIDAEGYLKRFIDIEYRLKEPNSNSLEIYVAHLLEHFHFNNTKNIASVFISFTENEKFSLRDINQLVERFNLTYNLFIDNDKLHNSLYLILVLIIVHEAHHDFTYRDYINPQNTPSDMLGYVYRTHYSNHEIYIDTLSFLIYLKLQEKSTKDWYEEHKYEPQPDEPGTLPGGLKLQIPKIYQQPKLPEIPNSSSSNHLVRNYIDETVWSEICDKLNELNDRESDGFKPQLLTLQEIIDGIELSTQFS